MEYAKSRSLLLSTVILIFLVRGESRGEICPPSHEKSSQKAPFLVLETPQGRIEIQLFESAAPQAVGRLASLVRGPVFNPALAEGSEAIGFFDGLEFDSIQPHVEIVTSTRQPEELFQFSAELDAHALGLDQDRVETTGQAMSIMQQELLLKYRETKKLGEVNPRLEGLIEAWYESYSPDGLIGLSRKEINEALGYSYVEGLETRPMARGAVALKPISPQHASARLTILLDDMPQRTGRWVVIGHVVEGLDVATAISLLPTVDPRSRRSRPLDPVSIDFATLICKQVHQEVSP